MDINIFEDFLNDRIANQKKILEEQEIKRKSTIDYLYEQILKQLDLEITESVVLFNRVLNEKCNNLNILVYHGNSLFIEKQPEKIREITILFDSTGKRETYLSKDLKSCDYLKLAITKDSRKDDLSFSYFIFAEYQFSDAHYSYEKNEFKTNVDDIDQNKILNDLKQFFDEFIKNYLTKSYVLAYHTKK